MLTADARTHNPYHLDVFSPHYLAVSTAQTPIIFTSLISFCVGVGLFYKKNGKVIKMGIYHSYSEHGGNSTQEFIRHALEETSAQERLIYDSSNFIRAIRDFLAQVENVREVTVIVHVNERYNDHAVNDNPENSYNFQLVRNMINQVCHVIGKEQITDFRYNKGGGFFCLLDDGTYYSDHTQIERIARRIAFFMHDHIARRNNNNGYFRQYYLDFLDGSRKKGTWVDHMIIQAIMKAHHGSITWLEACRQIQEELQTIRAIRTGDRKTFFFGGKNKDSVPLAAYEQFSYILGFLQEYFTEKIIMKK